MFISYSTASLPTVLRIASLHCLSKYDQGLVPINKNLDSHLHNPDPYVCILSSSPASFELYESLFKLSKTVKSLCLSHQCSSTVLVEIESFLSISYSFCRPLQPEYKNESCLYLFSSHGCLVLPVQAFASNYKRRFIFRISPYSDVQILNGYFCRSCLQLKDSLVYKSHVVNFIIYIFPLHPRIEFNSHLLSNNLSNKLFGSFPDLHIRFDISCSNNNRSISVLVHKKSLKTSIRG